MNQFNKRQPFKVAESPVPHLEEDEEGGKKQESIGVSQLVLEITEPNVSQISSVEAAGLLPSEEEVSNCFNGVFGGCATTKNNTSIRIQLSSKTIILYSEMRDTFLFGKEILPKYQ